MNVENISKGMFIKNYKKMCELLGQDVINGGNSKKAQIKDWERYFDFDKQGQQFLIKEVYSVPKPKETLVTKGNNSKYVEPIRDILIEYLYENRNADGKVLLSFSKLINILGLANDTYTIANTRKRELSDILNIELKAVYYFYNNTRSEFKGIVERALNNLQKRSTIFYNKKMLIVEKTGEYDIITDRPILKYREASNDEVGMILDAQKGALEYLGFEDFQGLFLAGSSKYKEFMKLVKLELPKDWQFFFNVYELIVGEKAIRIEFKHLQKRKLELNEKSIERSNTLLKITNDAEESILIDKLISVKNHDFLLDEEIKDLYYRREKEYFEKIKSNKKEINDLDYKKMNLILDNEVSKKLHEEKDIISKYEYYSYSKQVKDRKVINDLLDEVGLENKNYMSLEEVFADLL